MMDDSLRGIGNKRRSDPGNYPVAVPLQKRVDHMMMREKEKQERLENLRHLKAIEETTECTF